MANPHKGEVGFKGHDGKDYVLSFSINTLCELDDALGIDDAVNSLVATGKATLKQYRTIFYTALRAHNPGIVDEKAAADLVTLGQMMSLLTKAILLANPGEQPTKNGGDPVRPSTGALPATKARPGLAS